VWLVDCEENQQLQRLMDRDHSSAADARARISCQWPMARKRGLADQLIDNRGSLEQLHTLLQDLTDPAAGPLSR
jgi:dephospho-CoA kinase